jgi:hypothetical protein
MSDGGVTAAGASLFLRFAYRNWLSLLTYASMIPRLADETAFSASATESATPIFTPARNKISGLVR